MSTSNDSLEASIGLFVVAKEGDVDAWSSGVFGVLGRLFSCCAVLCACALHVANFDVFCALFCLPNVGQGVVNVSDWLLTVTAGGSVLGCAVLVGIVVCYIRLCINGGKWGPLSLMLFNGPTHAM